MKTIACRNAAGLLGPVVLFLILTGCATTPEYEFDRSVDFSKYRTFALMPLPTQSPASDPGAVLRLAEPARQAVVSSLVAKNFTETDREKADFAVNLRGQSVPRIEVRELGYTTYGFGRYGRYYGIAPGGVDVTTTQERTLAIEIFDNRTKQQVWVGWTKETSTSPKVTVEKIREYIARILENFPPPSGQKKT